MKRKKTRICLVCDQPFESYINHICRNCHKKHEKLFQNAPSGQWEDLIFLDAGDIWPESKNESENL